MGGGEGHSSRELDQTPTWAVALVSAIIILISILLEKSIHSIGSIFERRRKKALFEALEKIKGELMILGFISLLLSFGQKYITKVCIPARVANTMMPCPAKHHVKHKHTEEHRRRLLWYEHRVLAGHSSGGECKIGYEPLISIEGLHQLHIFIFFLAVFHVIYSVTTMMLGRQKIREWKEWEREVSFHETSVDPSKYRLTKETSFVKENTGLMTRHPILFYSASFFRQFYRSVRKYDYLAMRHGFVSVHLAPGSNFNFKKYIKRSLEDDFKVIVGINSLLWFSAVLYLLLNVHGWEIMFWLSILPLISLLAVGTKLQAIIAQMALEIEERHAVVQGIPLVQVSDRHFWFSKPHLVLHLIHLTLFQNAFDITYFLWISYEFGPRSCFHESWNLAIARVFLGVAVQFMCSYVTLPLYALVTQMGSTMKRSIFDEQTSKALMNWHKKVKQRTVRQGSGTKRSSRGGSTHGDNLPGDNDSTAIDAGKYSNNVAHSASDDIIDIQEENDPKNDRNSSSNVDLLTGP